MSSVYNINVYSGTSGSDIGKSRSYYISSEGSSKKKRHRSSTMKKWSISPEHFLSASRKTFRKDSQQNIPEKKIINELPIVEEPSHLVEEKIVVSNESNSNESITANNRTDEATSSDDQEIQTIANSQEELTEREEKSIVSIPIDNITKKNITKIVEEEVTKNYPSPENSVNAI
jgi:hypothetical protein